MKLAAPAPRRAPPVSVANDLSGFRRAYGSPREPDEIAAGDPEDEIRRSVCWLARKAVIRKCRLNLEAGAKPLILTVGEGMTVGKANAEVAGLTGRIDIMDAEQFIAGNLHKLSAFKVADRRVTLQKLVETDNTIIDEHETGPSLRINIG